MSMKNVILKSLMADLYARIPRTGDHGPRESAGVPQFPFLLGILQMQIPAASEALRSP